MQLQQFIDIIRQPHQIESAYLDDLEVLVKEYPFFQSAHLLYTKGLHKYQSINYSRQLRKTAIVANSRSVLYELIHKEEILSSKPEELISTAPVVEVAEERITEHEKAEPKKDTISPVSITNNDIKVIYVNTVSTTNIVPVEKTTIEEQEPVNEELNIVKSIENETEVPVQDFDVDKLNKTIEQEISKGIVQSYVETDLIKTTELHKEEVSEPSSFTDWLKTIQKEAHTFQIDTKKETPSIKENEEKQVKNTENDKKSSVFEQKRQLIDKIIESDPGRIKLGSNKFFTPATDAKQSLLENEHLVTETLAKIYALQGNISKAIRAYEILSLKFPQKSVYFASLIEKLKTNK
ncbi:MAG: hypothetical protein HY062_16365 [Bacteroidetes bacterium]|nr:hypothetical protein [Bacteroidota bacterium]